MPAERRITAQGIYPARDFLRRGKFPFRDYEFDYVICSHVLEHAEDPEAFLGELGRVAPRGYLEFPTVHYDYLYNFKEHVNLVLHHEGEILWMPKD